MGPLRRAWLPVAIALSVVLVPQLFTGPGASSATPPVEVTMVAPASSGAGDSPSVVTTVAPSTATTADSTTTTTTAAPPSTTTTTAPPPSTTAPPPPAPAPPPPPPPPPPPATEPAAEPTPANHQEGEASWYDLEGAEAGVCAHRTLPFGTVVRVTNLDNGNAISCTVGDRGPWVEGRIIDLYREDFAKLAPLSKGVIDVRLEW